MKVADIRKDYKLNSFNETDADENPFTQFDKWWRDALASDIDEVNAMCLSTISSKNNAPHSRIVLLKGFNNQGFTFFTNYNSSKGQDIAANNSASILFFWKELERQIRIEGNLNKISAKESDDYFYSRPIGSQIGAAASPQSQIINGRQVLDDNVKQLEQLTEIKRPEHWGGYILLPNYFEFWQGRSSRLHDRIAYDFCENNWAKMRLAP